MSNPVPLELQQKIFNWRQRAADGTLTIEEMKEAVVYLRAGRVAAAVASAASGKGKSKKPAPAAGDMLDELEGL